MCFLRGGWNRETGSANMLWGVECLRVRECFFVSTITLCDSRTSSVARMMDEACCCLVGVG